MPRIIKLTGTNRPTVADYNRDRALAFDDLIAEADIDPRTILAEARAEAERKVREAYEEGLRRGHAAGQQRFDEEVGAASEALQAASAEMLRARNAFLESLEPQLIRLAVHLAERILEREVQLDPMVIATTARAALEHIVDEERVVLRVNPRDLEVLRARKSEFVHAFDQIETVELASDPAIPSGGCIASTARLEIDARLSEQLATMMTQMLSEATGERPEHV